jgi:hypothetical protein
MQEKNETHQQLGEHGAIPGVPNGPPAAPITQLEIHPVAHLFPPMSEKEYEAFKASIIKEQRIHDPIWTYQGKIIDGRHRHRVSLETGIPATYVEWDGKGSLIEFVLAQNLHRRHLKEAQRAMVAARIKPQFEEEAKRRMEHREQGGGPTDNCREGESTELAGQMLSVSGKSVERACKVLDKGGPALVASVDACKLAVSTAADLADLPKEEQERVLAAGWDEIRKALQKIRSERNRAKASAQTHGQDHAHATKDAGKTPVSQFKPLDPEIERKIFEQFNNGWVKLTKNEQGYRMQFCEYYLDELNRAINRPNFKLLIERGVMLVKVEKGMA